MNKPLTERDLEVLHSLMSSDGKLYWYRPMDLGAGSRTHHSATLAKLEGRGLVASKQRGTLAFNSRGSKVYQITPKGMEACTPTQSN